MCHAACFSPSRRRSGLRRGVARNRMRTEAGKMPECLIFLIRNGLGVSNDRFGFTLSDYCTCRTETQKAAPISRRGPVMKTKSFLLSNRFLCRSGWNSRRSSRYRQLRWQNHVLVYRQLCLRRPCTVLRLGNNVCGHQTQHQQNNRKHPRAFL